MTRGGNESRNENREALAEVFLPSGTSPKTPGPDKPRCHAKARERDFVEANPVKANPSRGSGGGWEPGMGRWKVLGYPGDPAPAPVPGVSFTHHRRRHLGSTCRRDDVSGSGASVGTECISTKRTPCFRFFCSRSSEEVEEA